MPPVGTIFGWHFASIKMQKTFSDCPKLVSLIVIIVKRIGGGTMSVREHWINVRVNLEELARIREKQKELGIRNTGAYMRKMAMDGYCVNLDLSDVAQVSTLLRRCSNNLNQYAKRANESESIYAEDIRDLQKRLDELWEMQKLILKRLSGIR